MDHEGQVVDGTPCFYLHACKKYGACSMRIVVCSVFALLLAACGDSRSLQLTNHSTRDFFVAVRMRPTATPLGYTATSHALLAQLPAKHSQAMKASDEQVRQVRIAPYFGDTELLLRCRDSDVVVSANDGAATARGPAIRIRLYRGVKRVIIRDAHGSIEIWARDDQDKPMPVTLWEMPPLSTYRDWRDE